MNQQRENKIHQILDVAGTLFNEKGYDETSINDILFELGIAKGTLYHYFKSKESILDALIERINTEMKERALFISKNMDIGVLDRIIQTIMSLNVQDNEEVIEVIHQPQNALMHQKIEEKILMNITPILTNLVEEGILEGLFETKYPFEASEMLLSYSLAAFSKKKETVDSNEQMQKRMMGFVYNMERLLGTKEGELDSFFSVF